MKAYLKKHDRKHNPFRDVTINNKSLTETVREMTSITAENKVGKVYGGNPNLTLPYQVPEDIKEFLEKGYGSEEELGPLHALLLYLAREHKKTLKVSTNNTHTSITVGSPNIGPTVINFSGLEITNVNPTEYRIVTPDVGEVTTLENVQWYLSFYKSVYLVILENTLSSEDIVRLMQLGFVVYVIDSENTSLNPYLDMYNYLFPGFRLRKIEDVSQHNFYHMRNHSGHSFKAGLVEYPPVEKWNTMEDVSLEGILKTSSIILSNEDFYGFDKLELINYCKELFTSVYVYDSYSGEIFIVEKIRTMSKEAQDIVESFASGILPYAFRKVLCSTEETHSFNGFIKTYTISVLKNTEREGRLLQPRRLSLSTYLANGGNSHD